MYDLIIIGGGMSGIAAGHFFQNQEILLVEKADILDGATGNNAGFLITGFGEHFFRTAKRWGMERASEIQRIHLESHRMIRELTNKADRCGSLTVGTTSKEIDELRISHDWMRSAGFDVEWIENAPTGLRESKPALLNSNDGLIDSRAFWTQLAEPIRKKTYTAVLQVVEQNDTLLVVTNDGEFHAKKVIFCLNAFSGNLLPELKSRIIPLRGQMVELETTIPQPGNCPVVAEYGEIYWNFTTESLRFGGLEYKVPDQEVGIATSISREILTCQLEWIHEYMEGIETSDPLKIWYGTMGFTVDGFPIVGALPQRRNQYVLAGLCGLGNSYAMICASWLYDLINDDKNVIPAYFSSDRIWNLPEYSAGDWRSLYEAWNH